MEIEDQLCSNCSKLISQSKHTLHEAYCIRNMLKCASCGEVFLKSEMETHLESHKQLPCRHCGKQFEQLGIQEHEAKCERKKVECVYCLQMVEKAHICQKIPKNCGFCYVNVPGDAFNEHYYMCGNRTERCNICQKLIQIKNINIHKASCADEYNQKFNFEDDILNGDQRDRNIIKPQNIKQQIQNKDSYNNILNEKLQKKNVPEKSETVNQIKIPLQENKIFNPIQQRNPAANIQNKSIPPYQKSQIIENSQIKGIRKETITDTFQNKKEVKHEQELKRGNPKQQIPIIVPSSNDFDFEDLDEDFYQQQHQHKPHNQNQSQFAQQPNYQEQQPQQSQYNQQHNDDEDRAFQQALEMSHQHYMSQQQQNQFQSLIQQQNQAENIFQNEEDDEVIQKAIYASMHDNMRQTYKDLDFQEALKRSLADK